MMKAQIKMTLMNDESINKDDKRILTYVAACFTINSLSDLSNLLGNQKL